VAGKKTFYRIVYYLAPLIYLIALSTYTWLSLTLNSNPLWLLMNITVIYWFSIVFSLILTLIAVKAGLIQPINDGPVYAALNEILIKAQIPTTKVQVLLRYPHSGYKSVTNAKVIGIKRYFLLIDATLITQLQSDELKAIIAHEIVHIKNNDVFKRYFFCALVFILPLVLITPAMIIQSSKLVTMMLIILTFVSSIGLFSFALYQFRKMEYQADEIVVQILGQPTSLIQALSKLNTINGCKPKLSWIQRLFSTHPDLEQRVNHLQRLCNMQL